MHESNPLVLEILRLDKALKLSLFEQSELASTLRHYSQCQVSFPEIDRLCQEIVFILNKAGEQSLKAPDLIIGLKKTGQLLWDLLLTKQIKLKLKNSQISDLILCIDEELINIPWELLYDGSNFLCLNFNLGRLVRTGEQSHPVQYREHSSVLKMMILANPTDDLKSAYQEGVNIRNQFDRKRNNVHIDFKSTSIDKLYVKKNLCDYDIVHFAGHCEYSADNPRNSGWVLSDGRFSVHDILAMGSASSLPSLVFSNACYSAKTASYLIETDYQEKNFSLASAFLFSGVRHYIGAIRRIEDPLSLSFSKEFYNQLLLGKSVGECIRLGRLKLIKEHGLANIAWASYLLYGDPNFILLRSASKLQKERPKKRIHLKKKHIAWSLLTVFLVSLGIGLYVLLPTINPSSYLLFHKAQNLFQRGNNEAVIAYSNQIIDKDPSFLAVYPLLANTYQRLGKRDDALKKYFEYAFLCEKKQDNKSLSAAYVDIGWFYHLGGEYQKAFDYYNKAIALSSQNKDKLNEALALRKLAVWYVDKLDYNRALELLTKSSEINRQRQYLYDHRYNLACDYFDFGLVFTNKNDFETAKYFYNKSRVLFEKAKAASELSDYYFNLGELHLFSKEFQKALDCYMQGLKIDEARNDKINLASDHNMIGELYVEMDNFKEAESYFNRAIAISKEIDARPELATAYYDLGLMYKKLGRKNKAREYLREAQEIYSKIDTSSYEEVKNVLLNLDDI